MDAQGIRPTRLAGSLLAMACACQLAHLAPLAHAESLSFEAAQDRARGQAASVRAGKALFDQREEERAGWSGVGGPSVTLSGSVVKFEGPLSFDGLSRNSIAGSPDHHVGYTSTRCSHHLSASTCLPSCGNTAIFSSGGPEWCSRSNNENTGSKPSAYRSMWRTS